MHGYMQHYIKCGVKMLSLNNGTQVIFVDLHHLYLQFYSALSYLSV